MQTYLISSVKRVPVYWFEEQYLVSDSWLIENRKTRRIKSQHFDWKKNYLQVQLWKDNKRSLKQVHRVVKESFHWPSNLCVDHIDNNKTNNHLSNLDYVTHKENTVRAKKDGLMKNLLKKWNQIAAKPVLQYDKDMNFIKKWESATFAMRELWFATIYGALSWEKKTAYWFIWKYDTKTN